MLHYNFINPDPNTNYTITVIPINNVGVGNTSAATFFYKMISELTNCMLELDSVCKTACLHVLDSV